MEEGKGRDVGRMEKQKGLERNEVTNGIKERKGGSEE
jgi:hypothetical protein